MKTKLIAIALLVTLACSGIAGRCQAEQGYRPYTIAVLPDTQVYSLMFPEIFKAQTRWVVDNQERYGIELVVHLGDIVEYWNVIE